MKKKRERPIAFASRVLSKTERKWSVTERKAYALVWAVNYFRQYLLGNKFELISDHRPLVYLRNIKNPTPKIARWLLQLEEYNFTVIYKKGNLNTNADVMSRLAGNLKTDTIELTEFSNVVTKKENTEAQHQDKLMQEVMMTIATWNETSNVTKSLQPFFEKKDELFMDEDIMYRQVSDEHILPPSLQEKVLWILHDSPTAGHLGVDRTESRFKENYYWPNMRKIIAQYIKRCEQCEKYKPAKENTKANLQPIKSTRTMELIEIDFIGRLTTTKRGNKYILTIVDHFSKFATAYSTERQDTETVISCLNNYFSKYGPVERILSDQGRSFLSKEFLSFLKLWNITKSTSTSYHPQTQGLVERLNKTIIEILKRYVSEAHDTWDESVDMATYAYNTSIQRTTGMTPYEVMFGRKVKYLEKIKNETTQSEYVERLQKNHNKIEIF